MYINLCQINNKFLLRMYSYLKLTHKNKHKKYKYYQNRNINLHQIKKDLNIADDQPIAFLISLESVQKPLKIQQQALLNYLHGLQLKGQTIKIQILESHDNNQHEDVQEAFYLPETLLKNRSKSQEIDLATDVLIVNTEVFQATEQFYYNSNIQKCERSCYVSASQAIRKELNLNEKRSKLLREKKSYTNVQKLYAFLQDSLRLIE